MEPTSPPSSGSRHPLTHRTNESHEAKGSDRRLEFELCAWFAGVGRFSLAVAMGQLMEHGFRAFGRANVHPRRNPLDRQSRFAPQPGSDGQLAAFPACPTDCQPPVPRQAPNQIPIPTSPQDESTVAPFPARSLPGKDFRLAALLHAQAEFPIEYAERPAS